MPAGRSFSPIWNRFWGGRTDACRKNSAEPLRRTIAVANAHKGNVKVTFAHGAKLADPDRLFNAGLEGNMRRAIDYREGAKVDAPALKKLVRAAIEYNQG